MAKRARRTADERIQARIARRDAAHVRAAERAARDVEIERLLAEEGDTLAAEIGVTVEQLRGAIRS